MKYPEIFYPENLALSLEKFRDMDYYAVNNYHLPIELMMENAGLQLANLVASFAKKNQIIKIGVGNGNNGGGGLVAARRLSAWGYSVYIDAFTEITKHIPQTQLKRAIKFGAKQENISKPDIWIDAYLGFSQRLPLNQSLVRIIEEVNNSSAIKVSLDIPTGFLGNTDSPYFQADKILSLAAPKKILFHLPSKTEVYIADLGIPKEVYAKFDMEALPFYKSNIIQLKTQNHE
ncbi:MAG: NAD(P)H-hydrate epimerase [Bacteroidales bacterium]|nr:NAD(P)H-hydrate epimerase [Bacteroidales bacterium]